MTQLGSASHSIVSPSETAEGARSDAAGKMHAKRTVRPVPYVAQVTPVDCGAACLAMVLATYGRHVTLDDARDALGIDRDGTSARALLDVGRSHGLLMRGLRVPPAAFRAIPSPSILHWEHHHFVVFERWTPSGAVIVDPARGRLTLDEAEFEGAFSGVAITCRPAAGFRRSDRARSIVLGRLIASVKAGSEWWKALLTTAAMQLLLLVTPLLTGALVDRVVPGHDTNLLSLLALGAAASVLGQLGASLLRARTLIRLRTRIDAEMMGGFIGHLARVPIAFFLRRSAGDLAMRLSSNVVLREALTSSALSGALDALLVAGLLSVLAAKSISTALLVALFGALQIAVYAATRSKRQLLAAEALDAQSSSESLVVEMLAGFETLKSMGAELGAAARLEERFARVFEVSARRGGLDAATDSISGALRTLSPMVVLAWGAHETISGRETLGTMLALTSLATAVLGPIASLVATAGQLQTVRAYTERIDDVLRAQPEQDTSVPPAHRIRGAIRLDDVAFRYGAHAPLAVSGVSLTIRPGEFVAIVGRSGSGKSTLASLLLGLHLPASGRVLYDGVDLTSIDLRTLRTQLGIVTQRPTLFAGTVRENISLGDSTLALDAVTTAARAAQIDDELRAMPMGYDTPVLEGGSSLSGGQRQRIALARALARSPAVLLLDEATNALDAVTELAVQNALESLSCTRIVIAHRLSTIASADRIIVLEGGRVVEMGRHRELIANEGHYAALMRAQREG